MKEFRGTKGKWILRENKSTIMSNENCLIARVFDGKGNSLLEHKEQSDEIVHANALLIAHSPLLLGAIKDSIDELREAGLNEMADYHEKLYNQCVIL